MTAAPLLFYVFVGKLLQVSGGEYRLPYLLLLAAPWAVVIYYWLKDRGVGLREERALGVTRLAAVGLFYGIGELALRPSVNFNEAPAMLAVIRGALHLAWACSAGLLGLLWFNKDASRPSRAFTALGATFAASLLVSMILTVAGSPHPHIDCFTVQDSAADFILRGINPYTQFYADTYPAQFSNPTGNVYWPGALYVAAASKWLLGDVRYSFVLANLVTAAVLYRLGTRLELPRALRALVPLLWLGYPISLHVVEMAWVDPLLVAACALTMLGVLERRWWVAGLALGYGCALRQYTAFFAVLTLVTVLKQGGLRAAARLSLACAGIFAAFMLPAMLPDPSAFYRSTIQTLFDFQIRRDALSFPAMALNLWGYTLSDRVMSLSYLAVLAAAVAWVIRRKGSLNSWAESLVIVYGAVFLMGKQAACNYYFLLAYFVLAAWMHGARKIRS